MNSESTRKFPSADTVFNTLMIGGTLFSVTFLGIIQSVPSLTA